MTKVTFYYIGSCPVCIHYVESMKKLDKNNHITWHDFQKDMGDLGISYQEAVKQPLARDRQGNLQKGVDAFLTIWQELPYYRMLVPALSNPLVKVIFTLYYQVYAEWRLKKHTCYRYHGCGPHLTKKY